MKRRRHDQAFAALTIAVLQVIGFAHAALAATKTDKLYVTLEVTRADSPTFVCVISDVADSNARSLKALERVGQIVIKGTEASFQEVSRSATYTTSGTIDKALEALAPRAINGGPCSERWLSACRPTMTMSTFSTLGEGYIVCGRGGTGNGPVLVLHLLQAQLASEHAAVHDVEVNGATVTLDLAKSVAAEGYSVEVIGGDYAPSPAEFTTARWHTQISLQPLCSLHTIHLPPIPGFQVDRVTMTRTPLHATTTTAPGPVLDTCKPDDGDEFGIELPNSQIPEEKTLRVELGTARGTPTKSTSGPTQIALASRWTSVIPPSTIDLQFLALDFRWHRDCLTGRWRDPPLSATSRWNGSCPLAALAASGSECTLQLPIDPEDAASACRYHCDLTMSPLRLPAEVQFERIRFRDEVSSPEVIYAWRDTLHTLNEELRSFPPAIDHKLVVDFESADAWQPRRGNTVSEFRVVLPTGNVANVEITNVGPVSWASLAAPGLACSDSVRVAVFGERVYNDTPIHVNSGHLFIGSPEIYSNAWHTWGWVGAGGLDPLDDVAGISFQRSEKFVSVGIEFERYLGRSPFTLTASVAGQLSQFSYGLLADPTSPMQETAFRTLLFQRNDLRGGVGYWYGQNLHFALAGGFGWGFPVHFEDRSKVGAWRYSGTTEAMLHFRALPGGRAWLVLAGGTRFAERREFFTTDFIGDAVSTPKRFAQLYVEFRLRVRLQ